jgi:C-terminal processing protease CtpA/Prc
MDMIGRMKNGHLEILGSRTAPGLRRLVSEANGEGPTNILFDWKLKPDSDHWPFYERRVPFLFFHTGLHSDYHRPSDDAHLINHDGLAATTRIVFQLVMQVADADTVPAFRDAARNEAASSPAALEQSATPQPPRFGLPFRVDSGQPAAFIVTALNPGSPAEKSGIKPGDRLLEFQGHPIEDEAQFRLQLLAAHGETTFLVKRPSNDTPLLFKVTPSGDPIRVGVTWRLDDGEPGTVIVNQVIYGSAAHAAGLKVGDRIYSVARRDFKSQDEFVALLTHAVSPLEMLVERDGRLHTTLLQLLEEPPPAE